MLTCNFNSFKKEQPELFQKYFSPLSSSAAHCALSIHKDYASQSKVMDKILEKVTLASLLEKCSVESTIFAMMFCATPDQIQHHNKTLLKAFKAMSDAMLEGSTSFLAHQQMVGKFLELLGTENRLEKMKASPIFEKESHLFYEAQKGRIYTPPLYFSTHDEDDRRVLLLKYLLHIVEHINILNYPQGSLSPKVVKTRMELFNSFCMCLFLMAEQNVFKTLHSAIAKEDDFIQFRAFNRGHQVSTHDAAAYMNPKSNAFTLQNRAKAFVAFGEHMDEAQIKITNVFKQVITQ